MISIINVLFTEVKMCHDAQTVSLAIVWNARVLVLIHVKIVEVYALTATVCALIVELVQNQEDVNAMI